MMMPSFFAISFHFSTSEMPVRLALSDVGEIVFLPKILAMLRTQMPLASVHAVSPLAEVVGHELEYGRADLAIGYFPDLAGHSYSQQVLFNDPPFVPLGQYTTFTTYSRDITGVLPGIGSYPWNIRRV